MDAPRSGTTDALRGAVRRAQFRRWFGVYFLAAVLWFALGGVAGGALVASTDLGGLAELFQGVESPFPDEITFGTLVTNNLLAVGVTGLGLVSFGTIAVLSLLMNGLFLGVVVAGATGEGALLTAVALIVPHGVLELSAFFLVAGLSFRVTHRFVNYLRGIDETPITGQELFEIAVLLVVAALAIVVAAWIEAEITLALAEYLVGPL